MEKNLYEILGVSKDADEKEIKSAYRKKSLQYHPDRVAGKSKKEQDEAEDRMQEVNRAYAILSDAEKRKIYDMTGSAESAEKGEMGGFGGFADFGDFSDIFGGIFGRGRHGSSGGAQERIVPGDDLQIRLKVSIEELFNPKERTIRYKRKKRCPVCHGTGGEVRTCPKCGGTGMETIVQRSGFSVIQQTRPCSACGGTGEQVVKKCVNKDCKNGFVEETLEKVVLFPEGVQNGQFIVYENEGSEAKKSGHPNGRLIVIAQYDIDEKRYVVNGADVLENINVNYEDCILGKKLELKLPSGKDVNVTLSPLTPPGKRLLLRGHGLHMRDDYGRDIVGNYILNINYTLPEKLEQDERLALEDIRDLRKS